MNGKQKAELEMKVIELVGKCAVLVHHDKWQLLEQTLLEALRQAWERKIEH